MRIRHHLADLTLRRKLTLLLSAMVLLACGAVGIITNVVVHHLLDSRLDHDVALAGARYAITFEHNDHDADNDPQVATVGQSAGTLEARLRNGIITDLEVVPDPRTSMVVSAADRFRIVVLAAGGVARTTVPFAGLGSYRVQVTGGRDKEVLISGLPAGSVEDLLDVLRWTELAVFVLVAGIIATVGGYAVRRSLRPLDRLTATALQVSDLPLASGHVTLTERVPGGDRRTEVGKVAAAVNHMLTQVETALVQRQDSEDRLRRFIADASHELRTPLAIVRSHADLIAMESAAYSASARASLVSIDSGTRRMGRLVDDLLLLARLDSGVPLECVDTDLTRLVIESLVDARMVAVDHHWILDVPSEPVILGGDPERLRQVVTNLLGNARIHTPPGTAVSVSLSRQGEDVLLEITDNGPGIAPDLLPRVRERFTTGSGSPARRAGSSGLGLAIVAGVLDAHAGRLEITSEPGATHISIALPSRRSGDTATPPTADPGRRIPPSAAAKHVPLPQQ